MTAYEEVKHLNEVCQLTDDQVWELVREIESQRAALRACCAAVIDLSLVMKELLRRLPGNDDLASRVGYSVARLDYAHKSINIGESE